MNDPDERPSSDVLPKALAMFEEAAKEPRLTSGQMHALLFIASDTQIAARLDRLPTISDIARATGLTHSGASRLMGSLLKEGLVINDRGIMGNRSEAFVLSARGSERVTRLLEAMVAERVPDLELHSFLTYAHQRYAAKGVTGKLNIVRASDDYRTLVVTPNDDVLSEEVRVWCEESLSAVPEFRVGRSGVSVEFKTQTDAVYFKLKWAE